MFELLELVILLVGVILINWVVEAHAFPRRVELRSVADAHSVVIPVQVHDHNSNDIVVKSLRINIDENDVDSITSSFCEENDIQVQFCSILNNHVRDIMLSEREKLVQFETDPYIMEDSVALSLPNAHLGRHHSAVHAEYNRIFHPDLFTNFEDILHRERSITEYLKEKWDRKELQRLCFVHSCQIQGVGANSTRILEDILQQIRLFGLEDILDGIVVLNYGSPIGNTVKDLFSNKIEWIQVHDEIHYFEVPTLRIIHQLTQHLKLVQPEIDSQILYLHTKGVSYRDIHLQVEDWRNMMLHFLVEKHSSCIHLLQSGEVDCVGTNYRTIPHHMFSGNFWWATCSYLAARPEQRYEDSAKYEAETWLLNHSHARIFVLHNSNVDHALVPYPRSCYSANPWATNGLLSPEYLAGGERCGGPRTMREIRKYWQLL